MFTVDQDTVWIFQYSKPQSPESIYHWSAPRNFANHRVSAHLSLAQHIQEALSPTEDQTSRNSSPKCFGRGLWRSPLPCQWPSWWCGDTQALQVLSPPTAGSHHHPVLNEGWQCKEDPSVRAAGTWKCLYEAPIHPSGAQLSPVHSFSGNVDTSHVTSCTAERKWPPPPPLLLGLLPRPPCSVPWWTSWSHLNVELSRWHFADLITPFYYNLF